MELREPSRPTQSLETDRAVRWLLVLVVVLLVGLYVYLLYQPGKSSGQGSGAERSREVAAKLQAAGALDEAAALYEDYLTAADPPTGQRARIAFSLGTNYMQSGQYEKALRWFYEAETLGAGELSDELSSRIVHCLERTGRHHAAQTALDSRTQLQPDATKRPETDPVVARIGQTEIRRSEVERALDDLPPELAGDFSTPTGQQELLKKYVADELLWRKAVKLEYDRDPEVARRHAWALKQLAVARFVEVEVVGKIEVDETDLRNFFAASRDRYAAPSGEGEEKKEVSFDQARPLVERDYRVMKMQSAYGELIDSELATQDVEIFPERMGVESLGQ